jgi:predicted aspartyl protease
MKYWQWDIKFPLHVMAITVILALLCIGSPCYAQKFSFKGNMKRERVNFALIKNLIVIPLYINSKGPYNFLLDTGVGAIIITDPKLLDTLNLTDLRTIKVMGLGEGQEIEALLTNQIVVRLKSAEGTKITTAILKNDVFNLSNYLGVKIYGIIGYPFFNSFKVRINYLNKQMTYALPDQPLRNKGEKVAIEISNNRPYLFADLETSTKEKIKAKLIIDCGASHSLLMYGLNGQPFPLPKETIPANLGIGLSGLISGSVGRMPKLSFGKFSFNNVLSGFPVFESLGSKFGYTNQDGNLGAEVLRRFTVVYDYQNKSMYLQQNRAYRSPFEHDMSGIEIFSDAENQGRVFISRIEKDSPAEKAGFLVDDEILGINFKLIEGYTLEEIAKLFKAYDGSTVLVEVARGGKSIIKLFRLKKRI